MGWGGCFCWFVVLRMWCGWEVFGGCVVLGVFVVGEFGVGLVGGC